MNTNPPSALGYGSAVLTINCQAMKGSVGWELAAWALGSNLPDIDVDRLAIDLAARIDAGLLGPDWSAFAYPNEYALSRPSSRISDPFYIGTRQSASVTLVAKGSDEQAIGWRHPENPIDTPHCDKVIAAIHDAGAHALAMATERGIYLALAFEDKGHHSMATIATDGALVLQALARIEARCIGEATPQASRPSLPRPSL